MKLVERTVFDKNVAQLEEQYNQFDMVEVLRLGLMKRLVVAFYAWVPVAASESMTLSENSVGLLAELSKSWHSLDVNIAAAKEPMNK